MRRIDTRQHFRRYNPMRDHRIDTTMAVICKDFLPWMERKWELHLERSTWYDLKRTQTLSRVQTIRGSSVVHPIGPYNDMWYIQSIEVQNNKYSPEPAISISFTVAGMNDSSFIQ